MLAEFSLKLVYIPLYVGKFFKFIMFTCLENALNLSIHVSPHSKLAPRFLSSCPKQKETTHHYIDEGWIFTGRIKVGSVPGMINKDVLAQLIYKPV